MMEIKKLVKFYVNKLRKLKMMEIKKLVKFYSTVRIDSFLNKNRLYGRYGSIGVHPVGIEPTTSPIMSWAL
jgi:hypothetical protein